MSSKTTKASGERSRWGSIERMIMAAANMIRPVKRGSVADWAAENRYLNTPGAYVGPWNNATTPYLIEMMETLTSLAHTGMIIVGPARSGKSDIFFNWLGYSVDRDPMDMRIYLQTRFWAEDWSQGDLEKAFLAKAPGDRQSVFQRNLLPSKRANTLTRKRFLSGMRLNLSWPAITELSGKTVSRLWLNDYDHMEQDVNKMGNPFDLAKKRAGTFKQFGMCVAESTPAFPVSDPDWLSSTGHEAPPVDEGVLKLYNRGDRRRWYWRCPSCSESFEPAFDMFRYDEGAGNNSAIGKTVVMPCPCCDYEITESMRDTIHAGYPETCRWLKDGQTWDRDGVIHGNPDLNDLATFWLKGPAAFAQNWAAMVTEYLNAMDEYKRSGSTGSLKTNYELSRGEPFVMPRDEMARLPEMLRARAEDWGGGLKFDEREPTVPAWVRFLVATVDVQKRSFVVQITGVGEHGEMTLVDMFKIRKSDRVDTNDRRGEHHNIDPAGHLEDWAHITKEVLERTYPLADDPQKRRMEIKITGCDSGGRDGVTANAYAYYRTLRDDPLGRNYHRRFHLIKGESTRSKARRRTEFPDSAQRGPTAVAIGDVPVEMFNSNELKDQLSATLARVDDGGARWRFPAWAPAFFYTQMCAERRTSKGWENNSGRRNEAFDLSYYALGLLLHPNIRIEHIKWDNPASIPSWMGEWDVNPLVFKPDAGGGRMVAVTEPVSNLSDAASKFL